VKESKEYSVVGHKARRRDTIDKATGKAVYADDISLPNMAYGKALRSTRPPAQSRGINCDEAKQVPGVKRY
jgi:CO/xanthine dehydrogenase Mo-binding subunit